MSNTVDTIIKMFNLDDFDDVKKYLYTVASDCLRKSYHVGIYPLGSGLYSKDFLIETLDLLHIYVKYEEKNYKEGFIESVKKVKDLYTIKTKTSSYKNKYSKYLLSISEDIKNIPIEIELKPTFKEGNDEEEIEFVSLRKDGE